VRRRLRSSASCYDAAQGHTPRCRALWLTLGQWPHHRLLAAAPDCPVALPDYSVLELAWGLT
jgi:hypothetical protein